MYRTPHPRGRRRASEWIAPGALFALLLFGVLLVLIGLTVMLTVPGPAAGEQAPAAWPARTTPQPARATKVKAPVAAAPRRAPRAPRPTRVAIPAIGVSAPVIPLGLDRAGALEVPQDFAETGWWKGGPRPGERGPAVIAGHVDSYTGPAVFFHLGQLRRGDAIVVERADGSHVRFRVQRSARYSKARFPTAEVYGPTRTPALRLVTCSGTFDRASGHYLDNTVVYAGT
jgi:sortase (surface protein transpeptidase)